MKIGFIGLGNMGLPMARNLLRAGHEVTVHNRTRSKADELSSDGARVAESISECCSGEAVCTMLVDDAAVLEIADAILSTNAPNLIHISMSTISPALSRRLTDAHREKGQTYVAAPVFGRPEAAAAAKLVVVAAGPAPAMEQCRTLFDAIGQKTFHVHEEPQKANVIKVCGNFMLASMLETLGEAFCIDAKVRNRSEGVSRNRQRQSLPVAGVRRLWKGHRR